MMQHNETEYLELETFQPVKEQSTQLQEGIIVNLILIYDIVIKLLSLLYDILL